MKTITISSLEIPVLKELPDGWFLVMHPNCPAIAHPDGSMMTLGAFIDEPKFPERMRFSAISFYADLTFPLLKKELGL